MKLGTAIRAAADLGGLRRPTWPGTGACIMMQSVRELKAFGGRCGNGAWLCA